MSDFDVPVHTSLPDRHFRVLRKAATEHNVSVGALVRELVRRSIDGPEPAPRPPAPPRRTRTTLTPQHDERIRELHAEGMTDMAIAELMTISYASVHRRRRHMGLVGKPPGRPAKNTDPIPTDHQEVDA